MEGKKIKGRKRHILVDSQGFLLACHIHEANILDEKGSLSLLTPHEKEKHPEIKVVFADRAYRGPCRNHLKTLGWELITTKTPAPSLLNNENKPKTNFIILKWRWIVERTFGWLNRYRRLSKDYERKIYSSKNWVFIAMSSLMLRRFR